MLYGSKTFGAHMVREAARSGTEGHIVNTASVAGIMPGGGAYGASKHACVQVSETLLQELAAKGEPVYPNVGVSVLAPGFVQSNIWNSGWYSGNEPDERSLASKPMLDNGMPALECGLWEGALAVPQSG